MEIVHFSDLNSLNELLNYVVIIGLFISFFLFAFIKDIADYFSNKFQRPVRIKIEDGFLYRSRLGIYASKERCFELDQEFKMKRRQKWIEHHKRIIARLEKDD